MKENTQKQDKLFDPAKNKVKIKKRLSIFSKLCCIGKPTQPNTSSKLNSKNKRALDSVCQESCGHDFPSNLPHANDGDNGQEVQSLVERPKIKPPAEPISLK